MKTYKTLPLLLFALLTVASCEKESYYSGDRYIARISGYDMNCRTCILEFPYDSTKITGLFGKSPSNFYHAVNLNTGNFQVGDYLKCTLREPEADEYTACITLYPSFNYKSVYVSDFERTGKIKYGEPVTLAYHECISDQENKFFLCFDSVVNESRCPIGLVCVWAGIATVKLKYQAAGGNYSYFELNTLRENENRTAIPGFSVKLEGLDPYPERDKVVKQEDYKVRIVVNKLN